MSTGEEKPHHQLAEKIWAWKEAGGRGGCEGKGEGETKERSEKKQRLALYDLAKKQRADLYDLMNVSQQSAKTPPRGEISDQEREIRHQRWRKKQLEEE